MPEIDFGTKYIGDITGLFYLPDYQRGYRWTKEEIRLLLDDIYESAGAPYCLQPIVVKKDRERHELIDGQQRLTTIYLIFKYMESKLGALYTPGFSLSYETREESADFLSRLDMARRESNIDFHFIADAYEFIGYYFEERSEGNPRQLAALLTRLNEYFMSSVSVIWYEVDSAEDGIRLFERLNIGKIPLTSSELIKALFLKDSVMDTMSGRQEEVSLQWDMMEHELRNPSFWGFLSNTPGDQIPTRIDLVLDLMARKPRNHREKYYTFFYFDREIKRLSGESSSNPLLDTWGKVHHLFLTLREWYADHDFYHKIGYLISAGTPLGKIYDVWCNGEEEFPLAKDEFMRQLDSMIADTLDISGREELLTLSYDSKKEKLHRVLNLFNVETERLMDSGKRRFPFDRHKDSNWSLEHIHARNAESLKKNKDILSWLESHVKLLKNDENKIYGADADLIAVMDKLIAELHSDRDPGKVRERFKEIYERVIPLFTPRDDAYASQSYLDGIANMALLDSSQNSALSNSVFDVKRQRIIGYDQAGMYIPICTKHVFFKYYTSGNPTLSFWGETDRRDYVEALEEKIAPYYSNPSHDMTPSDEEA